MHQLLHLHSLVLQRHWSRKNLWWRDCSGMGSCNHYLALHIRQAHRASLVGYAERELTTEGKRKGISAPMRAEEAEKPRRQQKMSRCDRDRSIVRDICQQKGNKSNLPLRRSNAALSGKDGVTRGTRRMQQPEPRSVVAGRESCRNNEPRACSSMNDRQWPWPRSFSCPLHS